ncbi:MAG: universal stress protein [Acidimicrobiales bacterium]
MYSRIVVGSDGSETAAHAVARAGELAKVCGASLHIVCGCGTPVVADASMMAVPVALTNETVGQFEEVLEQQAAPLRAEGIDTTVHVETESGSEALLAYAEEISADLIVVGSQGMSGKRRFILGSVPNAVSHHATCSVLIVRTG